jgi:LacI family transcriptional regulator
MGVTIRDVARAAGVSVTTASRAFNNKDDVHPATRARVHEAAQRLGYVPDYRARGLVLGHTRTLGALIADNANPVYSETLRGMESVAHRAGYGLLLCNAGESQEQALSCLATLQTNRVEGVLITPVQTDRRDIEQLQQMDTPFIQVLRHFDDLAADYVVADHALGGYLVSAHLLDLGHRRLAHIAGPPHLSTSQSRLAGYRRALAERGLPYDEDLVARGNFTPAGGYEAAMRLLQRPDRPTAIFAGNDLQAVGVLKAARALDLRVPEDVALAGGDDIPLADVLEVPLTTFHVPLFDIGARATEILLSKLVGASSGLQQIVYPPALVVRRSSGAKIGG